MTTSDPESKEAPEPRHRKLKIGIDVLALILFLNMLIVIPVWSHYDPNGPTGKPDFHMKYILCSAPPALFSWWWLLFRYVEVVDKKFPFILTPKFAGPFLLCIPLMLFIIRKLLWG
jgi:hypothetical protein